MGTGAPINSDLLPTKKDEDILDLNQAVARTSSKSGLDAFLSILDDPYVVARYHVMAREGRLDASIFKRLLEYRHGRPPEKIEVTGKDGGPVQVIRRVIVDGGAEQDG